MSTADRTSRYGALTAAAYDALSGEWPVYGGPRRAAVEAMGLRPGDAVLDLGCGTGLNLPLVADAIGPDGCVLALDASASMLARVSRRRGGRGGGGRHGGGRWPTVHLLRADATAVSPDALTAPLAGRRFDAVIATYALSLMPGWPAAWGAALGAARDGARLAVVDMARPTGAARLLSPLALAATAVGGADIDAHPWTALEAACDDASQTRLRGGHVRVVVGTLAHRPQG